MSEFLSKLGTKRMIFLLGYVLLAISAFLPWVMFTYLFGGVIAISGVEVANGEPGILALFSAIAGILLAIAYSNTKRCGYASIGFASLMLVEVAILYPQIQDIIKEYPGPGGASIGAGLYLCVFASLISLFGGIISISPYRLEAPPPKQIAPTLPKPKCCIKCGAKLPDNAQFCEQCGQKVETEQSIQ